MLKFTDTHAHIYEEYYDNIDDIINKSNKLGIHRIISDGDNLETNIEMLNLTKKYNNIYITLGYHPEFSSEYTPDNLKIIEENLNNPKVVAIGEIGLDYHYENFNKDKQKEIFESQLILAEKNNLPVIIHSREATLDTITILKKHNCTGVIHCFSGSLETAKEYIKLGYKIGVGGTSTFKGSKIKEIIKEIGIKNILLETDSPYLSPVPFRGQKNYPGNVKYIAEFLSKELNVSIEELSEITEQNVLLTFKKITK